MASNELLDRLEQRGVPIRFESARELRRMSAGDERPEVLGLVESAPTQDLLAALGGTGLALGLIGLRYPANVGFILRALEVAGGDCAAIQADWAEPQFEEALRVSIRAERFMSVIRAEGAEMIRAARAAGRQIVALETSGRHTPWELDWTLPSLALVGSETEGLSDDLLQQADAVARIPIGGFIPSYNVQAAVGILIGEWLRQTNSAGAAR